MGKSKIIKEQEEELTSSNDEDMELPEDLMWNNDTQSCAELYRMYKEGQLEIQPEFQRNFVWKPTVQTQFIDSLTKRLPIPSIFIGEDVKAEKSIVIDGLQRITTIIQFFENEKWRLSKLAKISGKKVSEIKKNSSNLYARVKNSKIPVITIKCDFSEPSHMDYLFMLFNRLNTGGVKLNNQEVRNCVFSGKFNNLLKEVANSKEWENCMGKSSKIDRLENTEIILRTFAFSEKLDDYTGNLAKFLNHYMTEKQNITDSEIDKKRNTLISSLKFIYENLDEPKTVHTFGKNVKEGLLVGVSQNIERLKSKSKEEFQSMFENFLNADEFGEENLGQGSAKKDKVQPRLRKAVEIFGV
ncbi:MAG: DUF262 domain-containing protein [Firmicutes bacterium]|nr:DUF262 domain-containing protein [Bacillota bacterium]